MVEPAIMTLTPESAISWKIYILFSISCIMSSKSECAYLLEMLLLACGEIEHLFLVVDEHGALGFCLCNVEATREDRDFRLQHLLDHA